MDDDEEVDEETLGSSDTDRDVRDFTSKTSKLKCNCI